jgi:hypothetical protein
MLKRQQGFIQADLKRMKLNRSLPKNPAPHTADRRFV